MKFLRTASVLVLSAFVIVACDDEDTTGIEVADLAGTWDATQFEYTDNDNPTFSLDVISDLSGDLTIDVAESGSFTGTLFIPNITADTVPLGGSFSITGDTLSIDFNSASEMTGLVSDLDAEYQLSGDVLTLTNDGVSYDFPDQLEQAVGLEPRGEVSATVDIRLVR